MPGMQDFARSIVETVRHPMVVLDADQRIVSANAPFFGMLQAAPQETVGRSLYEVDGCRWDIPQLRQAMRSVVERATAFSDLEFRFDPPGEGPAVAILSARPMVGGKERAPMVLLAIEDDTERHQAREKLRQLNSELEERVARRTAQLKAANDQLRAANQELEAFCYSVSHDLRAPLRAIDGFSQELLESYADELDAQGQHYLQRVRAGVQRMGRLIDELLQLSRVTRVSMQRERVDLTALSRRLASELQQRWPDRQLTFTADVGMAAMGDPGLIEVVLRNLLENAWKFTSRKPQARVHVGHTEHEQHTEFFVRDDGAGFDAAYAGKLFGAFQRLHSEHEFPGTGIGLATVQRIIHRHGGQVGGEGHPDRGATFYFTLPRTDEER